MKSERGEKRIEVNVNIFVEMFVRATRRRENEGKKTRAHTTVWHAGCRPTDCLSPINGLPSLRLTHSTNPRGGFSTARLRGPRVHTHGAERGKLTREFLRARKKTPLLVFLFSLHLLLFSSLLLGIFSIRRRVRFHESPADESSVSSCVYRWT